MDALAKYREFLGREVNVVIDRPLGSLHPKFDTIYEVNYGYVTDTLAGDRKEIDAYVLGPDAPVEIFRGKCIAIVCRLNHVEHKLVISSEALSASEIHASINFVERYFETNIELLDVQNDVEV